MKLISVNTGTARPVFMEGRRILSAIGKHPIAGPVAVHTLGLTGDEQADPSVHGGLSKAVYAYPTEHMAFWRAQRREHRADLFADADTPTALPPGFMGENLSLQGLLETDVWVGDELHFPDCVLRVAAPREPCYKFNAVMGFAQAGRAMAIAGCCGYYLAVEQTGTIAAGQQATLEPGQRGLSIAQAFAGKFAKHAR